MTASCAFFGISIGFAAAGGKSIPAPDGCAYGNARLPTDPLGSFVLTLTNVIVGSRYRIERAGDASVATPSANAEGVAGASTVNITLDFYQSGSANNTLRIKVRKGTGSPPYIPYETQIIASAGAKSVYIAQVPDE